MISFKKVKQTKEGINAIFDRVMRERNLKRYKQLAILLGVPEPFLSKVRNTKITFGPIMAISIMEESSMTLNEIKQMLCLGSKE